MGQPVKFALDATDCPAVCNIIFFYQYFGQLLEGPIFSTILSIG